MNVAYSVDTVAATTLTVGIADMKVVAGEAATLITHALGSCLGITIHDRVARVSGLAHIMLPLSKIDTEKAVTRPLMFIDTGVPLLFEAAYRLGGRKENLELRVAGGAEILDANRLFRIGKRNYATLRKLLWKNNVLIRANDVGGTKSRTLTLNTITGVVTVRSNGKIREL